VQEDAGGVQNSTQAAAQFLCEARHEPGSQGLDFAIDLSGLRHPTVSQSVAQFFQPLPESLANQVPPV